MTCGGNSVFIMMQSYYICIEMSKNNEIRTPNGDTKVILHTCCAPCSSAIIEALVKNGITPIIYYCNPNIYPQEEYEIRKNECTRYAQALGLEIVDADYDHENWLEAVKGLEDEPERGGRCLKCFKFRLLRTAEYAAERGVRVMTTTLASSRWKSLEQINEAGEWACGEVGRRFRVKPGMTCEGPGMKCGEGMTYEEGVEWREGGDKVIWWDRNWRKGGLQERRLQIIKEYSFYNQLYCGCEFSMRKEI